MLRFSIPSAVVLLAVHFSVAAPADDAIPPNTVRVRGTLTDAETGEPIEKARLIAGSPYNDIHTTWQGHLVTEQTGGKYVWFNQRPWYKTRLRIEAEGYRPIVSPIIFRHSGDVNMNLKLRRDPGYEGSVVDSRGEPVANAQVAMTTQTFETGVYDGELRYDNGSRLGAKVVLTDAEGKFRLPAEADPFLIVAAHPQHGFNLIEKSQVLKWIRTEQPISISLAPWCRIECELQSDGEPDANTDYALSVGWQKKPDWPVLHHRSAGKTDKDGRFVCERVAEGVHFLQRWRKTPQGRLAMGETLTLNAVAGKTMKITVGKQKRSIVGRLIAYEVEHLPDGFRWDELIMTMKPKMAQIRLGIRPLRADLLLPDGAKQPAVKPLPRDHKIAVNGDGTFRGEGLSPGTYSVSLTLPDEPKPEYTFRYNAQVQLPIVDDADQAIPHDLGNLKIAVFPQQ